MRPSPLRLMDHREYPLLYVDDEPDNLRIFELTFRRDFTILTATSAEEGLAILNDNPIALVLSDHRMPGMMGVEFLARVRAIDPHTIRMLVTAYGDAETLGTAINDGSIYRYVPKPWDPDDLRLTIRRGIETYALDRERDALIRELTQLNQLSRDLHRELDLERVVSRLLSAMTEHMGFDAAALLFFDETGDALGWGGIEPQDAVADTIGDLEIGRDNAREFIEDLELGTKQVLRADQLDELPRVLRDWLAEVSAEEILVVPLCGAQRVIGAIAVDNRRGGRRLGAEDQILLDGVTIQAVVAIENARIVEALRCAQIEVGRSERIGSLAAVAGALASEIDEPVASIESFVASAAKNPSDPEESASWLRRHDEARQDLARLRHLAKTLGEAAPDEAETTPEAVSLARLVHAATRELADDFSGAGLQLECGETRDEFCVRGYPEQLMKVVVNLLDNARAATPAGGTVSISCEAGTRDEVETVSILVRDTGVGIRETQLERIFDPFYTTHEGHEGHGLGLTVSQQIVKQHGGVIEVQSRPGEGATFLVHLPVKPRPAAAHGTSA